MKKIIMLAIGMALVASTSLATYVNPVGGDGANTSLQNILNNITSPYPGTSSIDVDTDQVLDDEYWAVGGSGGSIATMIIELAGWAPNNVFGVYDASDASKRVVLFDGSATVGSQALLSILGDGSVKVNFADTGTDFAANVFGFFFRNRPGNTFFSDTSLNGDGFDHMVAYAGQGDMVKLNPFAPGVWGSNEYVLAFEDTYGGGDKDYQDMVLMIESVHPIVPEPGTVALMGLGLLAGVAVCRRKKS